MLRILSGAYLPYILLAAGVCSLLCLYFNEALPFLVACRFLDLSP